MVSVSATSWIDCTIRFVRFSLLFFSRSTQALPSWGDCDGSHLNGHIGAGNNQQVAKRMKRKRSRVTRYSTTSGMPGGFAAEGPKQSRAIRRRFEGTIRKPFNRFFWLIRRLQLTGLLFVKGMVKCERPQGEDKRRYVYNLQVHRRRTRVAKG